MSKSDFDPLAGLVSRAATPAERADRWAGHFLKLTLLFVFAVIALFVAFMLAETGIVSVPGLATAIEHWEWLGWAICASLGASLVAGILKLSYEMTD